MLKDIAYSVCRPGLALRPKSSRSMYVSGTDKPDS